MSKTSADERLSSLQNMQDNAKIATELLKSISNETRLMILCQLVAGEKSVTQMMDIVPLSQSAISQHLAILRRERIVKTRRDAQTIYYSLASDDAREIIFTLHSIYCPSAS